MLWKRKEERKEQTRVIKPVLLKDKERAYYLTWTPSKRYRICYLSFSLRRKLKARLDSTPPSLSMRAANVKQFGTYQTHVWDHGSASRGRVALGGGHLLHRNKAFCPS